MHIPVMPHEFTISGHNSCTSQSPSHNKSPLAPQLTPSMATSIRTTTTKTTNSPPSTLTSTTAAPRKPSQLGLYCTDKENGVRSIPAESVSSAVKASTVASVPKHIYDSAMKTFYSVVKFLGKGGFASCYEIVSDATGKHFAAKIVPKASIQKPKQKNKLLQEIKIHQSLRHDNIVRLYRVFEDDVNVYIIMDLCENHTMMEYIKKKGRLSDEEARPILLQLLASMQYLHENHVIHRDLKLGNLFLKSGPTVKLGDFGLATLVYGENDRKRTICGTPNYIAPEIIGGGERGHSYEVDIWSFGVIMYTLLVGRPPFQQQEVKEIYEKIKVANFDFPVNLAISAAAKDIINRLLHPNPEKRPQISEIREHAYFTGKPLVGNEQLTVDTAAVINTNTNTGTAAGTGSGTGSGLIISVKQATQLILSNYSGQTSQIEQVSTPKFAYLHKCHDFSSKYGIAYVVSNGSNGCYFNDGTSLVISHDKSRVFYFQPGNQDGVLVRESFNLGSREDIQSEDVQLRLKIMTKLEAIFAAERKAVGGAGAGGETTAAGVAFLMKYFKSPQATFYRLSNRVLQVNFFDGSRLLFAQEGQAVVFFDGERRGLAFSSSTSRVHLSSLITGKIQYVNDIITSIIRGNK